MFDGLQTVLNSTVPADARVTGLTSVEGFVAKGATIVVIVAASVGFVTLAIAFIKLALAWGDPKGAQEAYQAIIWSAMSFVIAVLAFVLKNILLSYLMGSSVSFVVPFIC